MSDKKYTYKFGKSTSYVDALEVCDMMVEKDLIKDDYTLDATTGDFICRFNLAMTFEPDANILIRIGSAWRLLEMNETSLIRKFNDHRKKKQDGKD